MKRFFPVLLLLTCAALIAGTFYILLKDRFESGDVYPASSSLRSDPLGTMIFFESLQALPGVEVKRDHSPVNRLPAGRGVVYLHLAAPSSEWTLMPVDLYRTIEAFLLGGGRLVVTLSPEYRTIETPTKSRKTKDSDKEKDAKKSKDSKDKEAEPKEDDSELVSLEKKWGLKLSLGPHRMAKTDAWNVSAFPLPPTLRWNGDVFLENADASWRVLYKNEHGPVIAEKKRGAGSIVIATDSFFLSNEALVRDRHADLLAWLVGPTDHVVFDEAHFGIVDTPGIAALARKYRLHGAVAALIVLAGLFIWKNALPLTPRRTGAKKSSDVLTGRAAGAGFVSLLKRNIPADRVFEVCLQEWKKTFGNGTRFSEREKEAVEQIAREELAQPVRERDPVAACQRINTALRRHSTRPAA